MKHKYKAGDRVTVETVAWILGEIVYLYLDATIERCLSSIDELADPAYKIRVVLPDDKVTYSVFYEGKMK